MAPTAALFAALVAAAVASAQSTVTVAPAAPTTAPSAPAAPAVSPKPLTEYNIPYSAIPYQVNPYPVLRGPQSGYNLCNSTTEGPDALCQTAVFNSIEDFCIWGGPGTTGTDTIGVVEAAVVAYCSRSGHGARIFPEGTFQSLQFMKTPAYIQIVGYFNQTAGANLAPTDTGGELDPHGADLLGNPLGGLFYSTGFSNGDGKTYVQTQSWNNFVGSGVFCLKLCDPSYSTDKNYCQNIYDLIGCTYNMPADYATLQKGGVFESCEGEIQDEVGTYTSNGQTYTWSQPETLAASTTLPWTPRVPASSNCKTYQSTDLFPIASLGYQSAAAASSASAASAASASASATPSVSNGKAGAAASASRTGSGSAAGASSTSKGSAGLLGATTSPVVALAALMAAACLAL
ncbi:hypothetical protein Q8F55_001607 [Vanrija albida]|uniref:Macrofage activating glycoprotein n=1 Tax=Vanrija albida TaxID=181172 RepID=A0ABR3QHC0_9TREE